MYYCMKKNIFLRKIDYNSLKKMSKDILFGVI